ncbi:MAG TPA: right-handed parallel beta-helix repeat-containing protein [Phenylobacterium sp.]|uniref:right-handed parallel beta-helix repeat-containing protein n=1 Tax=Phenylobacterium sp. TaxID=1871053 RepID=UPI002D331AF9|nr:right-handed parallel beta-helix repeat-containing protein [Phenylobacterium sp.]HZZ69894.1 right-handed parallel beta-helix repeat-containing protein [Phenylobacterium sp.]
MASQLRIALAVLALLVAAPAWSAGPEPGYYVNFASGNDNADGRSAATAWRHAPGDPSATGVPAARKLAGGDAVYFAPGVRYRGGLILNGSGTAERPIVFTSAPGGQPAIIDGSDPAQSVRPCRSAEDCGGAKDWAKLVRADFGRSLPHDAALFTETEPLFPAQSPNAHDIFNSDQVDEYLPVNGADLAKGIAHLPGDIAKGLATPGEKSLALWINSNQIVYRDITSLDGEVAHFDPTGLGFFSDRPDRIAVVGHPSLVDQPGEYALIEDRSAAVVDMPKGASQIFFATGRGGIEVLGHSNVVVKGLTFENMADDGKSIRAGIAVANSTGSPTGLKIVGNRFRNFRMLKGQGPIILHGVDDVLVADNDIETVALGSAMRISKCSRIMIRGNHIRRIGRTGVMLMADTNAEVAENTVSESRGVHGNGLSVYLDNRDIRIVANTIVDSIRPATFKGNKDGQPNNILFAHNLFVGSADSDAAITSWGDRAHGVTIEDNVLMGGKVGARLSTVDLAVTVRNNLTDGVATKGKDSPVDWQIESNRSGRIDSAEGVALLGKNDAAAAKKLCSQLPASTAAEAGDGKYATAIGADLRCAR